MAFSISLCERLCPLYCFSTNTKPISGVWGYFASSSSFSVSVQKPAGLPFSKAAKTLSQALNSPARISRASVFPPHLPLRTKIHEEVSTYYGETAKVQNCLIADGCRIEGELEHCLIFSGVHIEPQVRLQNCIVMRGAVIHGGAQLQNVVLDKYSEVSATTVLRGSDKFPFVLPKSSKI